MKIHLFPTILTFRRNQENDLQRSPATIELTQMDFWTSGYVPEDFPVLKYNLQIIIRRLTSYTNWIISLF